MFNKLKQIKDLREKAKTIQSALADVHVEGTAAWGKVKIALDGNQQVTDVQIDESLLAVGEKTKLQTAIKEAFADALKKVQTEMVKKMKESGDFNLPGLN